MSELSYKELQEQGVFDVPYRAFEYMQSQQVKIDELKKKYDAMYNAFIVADDCRKEWHESYMSARKGRDELQARIDGAMKYIEPSDELSHKAYRDLVKILKGNKDEN